MTEEPNELPPLPVDQDDRPTTYLVNLPRGFDQERADKGTLTTANIQNSKNLDRYGIEAAKAKEDFDTGVLDQAGYDAQMRTISSKVVDVIGLPGVDPTQEDNPN